MEEDDDKLVYLGAGLAAPILLGMALVPLRGLSTASNFTFGFIILTIVVAEYGGRWAAVACALSSALSLDFFLTQPYLKLTIEDKHDVIAFAGLAVCGLTAAALGSRRPDRPRASRDPRADLELLHLAIEELEKGGASGPRLARVLEACVQTLPLEAAVVRDGRGDVLASSARAAELRPVPEQRLDPETLLSAGSSGAQARGSSVVVPRQGARVALLSEGRPIGWFDLWGDESSADPHSRRTLADVARVAALLLAGPSVRPEPGL